MNTSLTLDVKHNDYVNFNTQQHKIPMITSLALKNNGTEHLQDVKLVIRSVPEELCLPFSMHLDAVPAGRSMELQDIKLLLNPQYLAKLTEKLTAALEFIVTKGEQELLHESREFTVLAFDEWHGSSMYRELLAAFVTPNEKDHVPVILKRASELLGKWTGNPSLNSYLSKDINRVKKCIGAIYTAISEYQIAYATLKASFEPIGQRVRLIHSVMKDKLANCMDFTLLLASCLEAADLNPLLILIPGHIYCGAWLVNQTFPNAIVTDANQLISRLDEGNQQILVFESTLMRAGVNCGFDGAVLSSTQSLKTQGMNYCVDVVRARQDKVTPLPQVGEDDEGLLRLMLADPVDSGAESPDDIAEFEDDSVPLTYTKLQRWEANLLNTDMRNPLLNQHFGGKRNIPIYADSLQKLLDALSGGEEFVIHPLEGEAPVEDFESLAMFKDQELIASELENHRLRTPLAEKDLPGLLKVMFNQRNTSRNEMGANTLYLSLGHMCWQDAKLPKKNLYAPVVLVPFDVEFKSGVYRFRIREEETLLNATLMEKLRRDHRLEMPTWDNLPVNSNGCADIRKILGSVRRAIADQPGWSVLECAAIGHFAFAKFAMWRDVHDNGEILMRSPIVRSLAEGKLCWDPDYELFRDGIPEGSMVIPIAADGSQMFAIERACKGGETFVLHGPPGAGKSQCITAMICHALANGLRVLLVSEKMTALEVPQSRLSSLGLDVFCLELHSNKTGTRKVLETYDRLLEMANAHTEGASTMAHTAATREYTAEIKKIAKTRQELDRYSQALHADRPCGMSLYTLMSKYVRHADGMDFPRSSLMNPEEMTEERLAQQEEYLERLTTMRKALGSPAEHPLCMVSGTEFSQQRSDDLRFALKDYREAITGLQTAAADMTRRYDLPQAERYGDYQVLNHLADKLERWDALPRRWTSAEDLDTELNGLENLAMDRMRLNKLEKTLRQSWKPSFLELDAMTLIGEYNRCCDRPGFLSSMSFRQLARRLAPHHASGAMLQPTQIASNLELLRSYQTMQKAFDEELNAHGSFLGDSFGTGTVNWTKVLQTASETRELAQSLEKYQVLERHQDKDRDPGTHRALAAAWTRLEESHQNLNRQTGANREHNRHSDLNEDLVLCDRMLADLDSLRDWTAWNRLCAGAEEAGLGAAVDALRAGRNPDQVLQGHRKSSYQALISHIIDHDPALSTFTGIEFNQQIQMFRQMDDRLTQLSRDQLRQDLAERVTQRVHTAAREGNDLNLLHKAIAGQGKNTSIRQLFAQIPDLLMDLTPCMLMSPQSVAQYLPMQEGMFDLVIFDEASQLTTSNAVGALARGKAAVIVGDNRQMPPTSFFTASTADGEHPDVEDLESVLDDCLALNMPSTHLRWHRRSRHESLINFSNHYFYDNKMLTFPSASDRSSHVHLKLVADGVFDRGKTKTNRPEAAAVITELKAMSQDESYRGMSVAVITPNVQQQDLIDEMLQQACREDEALSAWLRSAPEPILIQNLENIQGHERDVVFFCVGYGPDSEGKVSMNFGPLNREGGWRRLNVAITRARQEMKVFSSLSPEQIKLTPNSARGVVSLRWFLEYAGGKELPVNHHNAKSLVAPAGVTDSIAEALKAAGYDTVPNLGHSDLRVDLAVIDPDHPDQYLLGILLDGMSYGAAKTTRDRELGHVDVLQSLGWDLHRIWIMDWWDDRNSGRQIRTLLKKLDFLRSLRKNAC